MLKLLQHQESCYSSRAARIATGGLTAAPEAVTQVSSPPPISYYSSEVEHSGRSMIGGIRDTI